MRTTIISDAFKHGRVELRLKYLRDQLGGDEQFTALTGHSFNEMKLKATIDRPLRDALLNAPLADLQTAVSAPDFGKPTLARTA